MLYKKVLELLVITKQKRKENRCPILVRKESYYVLQNQFLDEQHEIRYIVFFKCLYANTPFSNASKYDVMKCPRTCFSMH